MPSPIRRRTVLKSLLLAAPVLDACGSDDDGYDSSAAATVFPQSLASGDPRPDSVVLWTRLADAAAADRTLRVQVATDAAFQKLVVDKAELPVRAVNNGCVKVKVTGLLPGTTYHFRFLYATGGRTLATRPGRTKTAPLPGIDLPVRFAVVNCQDYIGRYWNSLQVLAGQAGGAADLDFVVALGDYVYETTGDPTFQSAGGTRSIVFSDPPPPVRAGQTFSAARSLGNYRELYQVYRADLVLQRVHEMFPFIVTWDDHEFSDDCHADVATYTDGRVDETDAERRRNAEQAFFEFMPVDDGSPGPTIEVDRATQLFPNTHLFRSFTFGKHLELLMTDYRSFRPDHLIPEDAFPGTVVLDAPTVAAANAAAALSTDTFAYVDIDAAAFAPQKAALVAAVTSLYAAEGIEPAAAAARAAAVVTGNLALIYVNAILASIPGATLIPTEGTPRGVAYVHLGKQALFARLGARYLVIKPLFDLFAAVRYAANPASQDAFGVAQESYLLQQLAAATTTWKVVASSTSMTSMTFNLQSISGIPPALANTFYLNLDQWDGFPNKREQLLAAFAQLGNVAVISGDIHAGFVSAGGPNGTVPLLTAPAVSSQALVEELSGEVAAIAQANGIAPAVAQVLVANAEALLRAGNPAIVDIMARQHGFMVFEAGAAGARVTYHLIAASEVTTNYAGRQAELAGKVTQRAFLLAGGTITSAPV